MLLPLRNQKTSFVAMPVVCRDASLGFRWRLAWGALFLAGLATAVWFGLRGVTPTHTVAVVSGDSAQQRAARRDAARRAWAAVLKEEDAGFDQRRKQAQLPVDAYFDEVALPHIGDFLADFTGLFYDTPRFVYKWLADKLRYRDYSDRVNDQVKGALREHLQFPDAFNAAIRDALVRFHTLQRQRDAELRDKAYSLLHGAGVETDRAQLDALLEDANAVAERSAFETGARESAINFAGVMAGKEVAVYTSALIVERVMVAVGTRMGVVTVGAGAAGATAGAGTATGVAAVPSWVVAALEIAVTVIIDLAVGWWLEAKAEATMRAQLNDIRAETHKQLEQYMQTFADSQRRERAKLIDTALAH